MMNMTKISECDVQECAYNTANQCHALAITVGDMAHPRCDTFLTAQQHGGDPNTFGQVGACKVSVCKFNKSFECSAPNIHVGHHKKDCADCLTFQAA